MTSEPTALSESATDIRICHIARDIASSGGGEVAKQVASEMAHRGATVVIVTDTPGEVSEGVEVRHTAFGAALLAWTPRYRLGWHARHALQILIFSLFSTVVALPYRLRGFVIFNHNCESLLGQILVMHNVFSAELSRRALRPVLRLRAMLNPVRFMRISKEMFLASSHGGRSLVAVSEAAYSDVVHLARDERRVSVIPNGVDLAAFHPDYFKAQDSEITRWIDGGLSRTHILFVGHEFKRKGLDELINALKYLPPEFVLTVVGGRSQNRHAYDLMVDELELTGRVWFVGEKADIRPYLAYTDVFCLPSTYETMPLVALEALSAGIPIVLTSECPAADRIQSGLNGFVCSHDPEDIASQVRRAALIPSSKQDKQAIRGTVVDMGWASSADMYLTLALAVSSGAQRRQAHP